MPSSVLIITTTRMHMRDHEPVPPHVERTNVVYDRVRRGGRQSGHYPASRRSLPARTSTSRLPAIVGISVRVRGRSSERAVSLLLRVVLFTFENTFRVFGSRRPELCS